MKQLLAFFLVLLFVGTCARASDLEEKITEKIGADEIERLVPESITQSEEFSDLELSYSNANSNITAASVFNISIKMFIKGLKAQAAFLFLVMSFVLSMSIYRAFSQSIKHCGLDECINILIALFLSVILFNNVMSFVKVAQIYVTELLGFIKKLLPFFTTLLCMEGEVAKAATSSTILLSAITLIESAALNVIIPLVKALLGFVIASYVSKINFLPVIDFISSTATKLCVITMSVLLAILHFKGSLSKAADSLALRSVKILAGSFIPIVGGMVSEASATLIAGAKLVKTTIGVFGFAILIYLTLNPIITILLKKLSFKILSAFSSILGCDDVAKNINSMYGVLNILSAFMISSCVFFVISIAIIINNGV